MKIVSWNVNGLRACIKKSFIDIFEELNADVYCIEETKAPKRQIPLKIEGYDEYWNTSRIGGYSGVLVLSKEKPLSVREGFGIEKFDIEGRLLTLEFEEFYLLCVYMPMSKGRLARNNFRSEWDDSFLEYIKTLSKPLIICGDFNVAHKFIDIYPENLRNEENPSGFLEFERTNFDRLLDYGLVDVYRHKNPDTKKYTWWSNRGNKRKEDRGWRLDYFLVSQGLVNSIVETEILNDIHGSDHCPISLKIKTTTKTQRKITDSQLAQMWEKIDWEAYEAKLLFQQQRLAKAVCCNTENRISRLQREIMASIGAKVLAVRHVSNTHSEPGITGGSELKICDVSVSFHAI